jgi:hypothetical protein
MFRNPLFQIGIVRRSGSILNIIPNWTQLYRFLGKGLNQRHISSRNETMWMLGNQTFFTDDDQSGTVAVNTIVLIASVVSIGLATLSQVQNGLSDSTNDISSTLTSYDSVVTSGEKGWFDAIDGASGGTDLTPSEKVAKALDAYNAAKSELADKKKALTEIKQQLKEARSDVSEAKKAYKAAKGDSKAAAKIAFDEAKETYKSVASAKKSAAAAVKTTQKAKKKAAKAYKAAKKAAG